MEKVKEVVHQEEVRKGSPAWDPEVSVHCEHVEKHTEQQLVLTAEAQQQVWLCLFSITTPQRSTYLIGTFL